MPTSRYAPVGSIRSARIGLHTRFYSGVHEDVLKRGPGLWPGTASPGDVGNAVLSGHRTTHTRPFAALDELSHGSAIRIKSHGRPAVVFRVTRTTVVAEDDYVDFVLRKPRRAGARVLTLFACHPKGYRTHRIVVRATAGAPAPSDDAGPGSEGVVP